MLKKVFLPILIATIIGSASSCNSKDDDSTISYIESSSVTVTGFYIKNDKEILDSLSNVFFSIDLVNAKIFNADSLPYGTKVDRLIPSITTSSVASVVELSYYDSKLERDSVVNYLTNSTDSIDFSNGPVKLKVVSQSGSVTREYEIRVNVHQVKSDSLAWYSIESAPLPTTFTKVEAQRTAQLADTYYCLSTDGTAYSVATTTDPSNPQWQDQEITFAFNADVESLNSTEDALYILDKEGNLYKSTDCLNWSTTGQKWHYIYGNYQNDIVGCTIDNGTPQIVTYPSMQVMAMPDGFPIGGTSQTTTYKMPMGFAAQLLMVGGRTITGELINGAWSYDGNNWAEVSIRPIPQALEYVTMVPYHLVEYLSTSWAAKSFPVLFALGGRTTDGSINRTIYYSRDWGMTWTKAPELTQWPEEMPSIYGATGFEYSTTLYPETRNSDWINVMTGNLPPSYSYIYPRSNKSRAVAPLTEWECPAIYLFGGRNEAGQTQNTLWRGVILNFTFEPVQ